MSDQGSHPLTDLTDTQSSAQACRVSLQGVRSRVDFLRNTHAFIENPLAHLTLQQLSRDVQELARQNSLQNILPLLEKGAQIARDPEAWEGVQGLTEDEKEALKTEDKHPWKQPAALYATIGLCSIGAALQGWDQTGSNGANLSWPQELLGLGPNQSTYDSRSRWIIGMVNAAPYFAAATMQWMLALGPLEQFPRSSWCNIRGSSILLLLCIGFACAQEWWQLLFCRLLLGVGMGIKASTVPIYAAESSPKLIRGSLVMGWQLWTAFGIFLGFSANLAVYKVYRIAWRLQLGSAFIPAVPLLLGIFLCPESPRWRIKKGEYWKAYKSLERLNNVELQAARELYKISAQVLLEEDYAHRGDEEQDGLRTDHVTARRKWGRAKTTYASRFLELFYRPRIYQATLASVIVMLAQQMCGINVVAFYSSTLFKDANASETTALWMSWGFGLTNFLFAWPAVWAIDKFGRRSLLLFTFPHMAWTLLAAGLCFFIPGTGSTHFGPIAFFIILFSAFYSPGEGPVPFTYSSESFPLSHREVGMSLSVAINLFFAGVLTLLYVPFSHNKAGALGVFAGLNVLAFVMIFLWVPETKQYSLEELDYIFGVPIKKHTQYQLAVLHHKLRRYFLGKREKALGDLYTYKRVYHDQGTEIVDTL